jgi:hypothetical protein
MVKPIVVSLDGIESSFDHSKLERHRLYGVRKRIPLDQSGQPCIKAALTTDGLYLLQSGMTAQGYFDEGGRWLQKSELQGLDQDNKPLELKPSTLGTAQALTSVPASEVLRHVTEAVYRLDPLEVDTTLAARLDAGEVFRFGFNYGADYHLETAFLVANPEGVFCLVGVPILPAWSEPGLVAVADADEEASDDLDFDMF